MGNNQPIRVEQSNDATSTTIFPEGRKVLLGDKGPKPNTNIQAALSHLGPAMSALDGKKTDDVNHLRIEVAESDDFDNGYNASLRFTCERLPTFIMEEINGGGLKLDTCATNQRSSEILVILR